MDITYAEIYLSVGLGGINSLYSFGSIFFLILKRVFSEALLRILDSGLFKDSILAGSSGGSVSLVNRVGYDSNGCVCFFMVVLAVVIPRSERLLVAAVDERQSLFLRSTLSL